MILVSRAHSLQKNFLYLLVYNKPNDWPVVNGDLL